jgi:aminoglycoside phosphotransferase (APT) family kinase protein
MPALVRMPRTADQIAEQEARFRVAMHLRAHPEADRVVFQTLRLGRTWLEIARTLSILVPTAAPVSFPHRGPTPASRLRPARAVPAARAVASGRAVAAGAA